MRQRIGRRLRSSSSRRSTWFPRHVIFGIGSYVSGYTSFFVCFLFDVYDSGDITTGGLIIGFVGAFR